MTEISSKSGNELVLDLAKKAIYQTPENYCENSAAEDTSLVSTWLQHVSTCQIQFINVIFANQFLCNFVVIIGII